ncbi:unnamed protein product, partial [Linum tenue]
MNELFQLATLGMNENVVIFQIRNCTHLVRIYHSYVFMSSAGRLTLSLIISPLEMP